MAFSILCRRSYGSVFKALHKETGNVLAIKQVPVDTDLQEIIKEISIMQQCDSPFIVKYYGSYFKNSDLWVSWDISCGIDADMRQYNDVANSYFANDLFRNGVGWVINGLLSVFMSVVLAGNSNLLLWSFLLKLNYNAWLFLSFCVRIL